MAFFFVETLALQRTATKRAPQRRCLFRSFFGKLGQRAAAGVDVFNSVCPAKKAFPVEVSKLLSGELAKVRAQERHGAFTVGSRSTLTANRIEKLSSPFKGASFAISSSVIATGSGRGSSGISGVFSIRKDPVAVDRTRKEPQGLTRQRLRTSIAESLCVLSRMDGKRGRNG